ncbi:MAG TPA: 30S ribosomal protein S6 [Rhabdochlamydiaceae bacterium]|nr:30S ribosomal protein S6 [Rhabdochlamydiaceae bacterium]
MSKQKKHLYEGMYILSATLSEDARQKALERITSSISERDGEVLKLFEQGRRKLAYEINGRREGYYYVIYFNVPTSVITDLWKDYHLNEDLIRFMTMRTDSVPEKLEFKSLIEQ